MFKFSVSREDILKPLDLISGPAPTGDDKNNEPILKNVYLSVFKINLDNKQSYLKDVNDAQYGLLMKCTDTEIEMTTAIPLYQINDIEEGDTTVNADILKNLIKNLPVATIIDFYLEGNNVHLTTPNNDFSLVSQPASQFPTIDTSSKCYELKLNYKVLLNLMKTTAFSIAQDNYRVYLKGMRFLFDDKELHVCTADGHRLSMNNGEIISKKIFDQAYTENSFIFPKKGVSELIKLIEQIKPEDNEEITLTLSKNSLVTNISNITLVGRLLDSKFPQTTALLSNLDIYIIVNKEEFMQSLRRVSVLCSKSNAVEVFIENQKLMLITKNAIREEGREIINPIECSDVVYQTGLNSSYLIDICKAIPNKLIKISMSHSCRNALIEPVCSDEDEINYSKYIVSRRVIG
jgi:DNA polymerase-3 subunit beta